MAPPAIDPRLAFAARQALACTLTVLVGETFQIPEIALTVYMIFFLNRVDRASSLGMNVLMTVLLTIIIGLVLVTTMMVIDQPGLRFISIGTLSFGFLFLTSASKLRPVGAIIALIVGYALDMLGVAHAGETATRALLYAWLFIAIPAGVSVIVNLIFAPSPRRLVEKAIAHRLSVSARVFRGSDTRARAALEGCLEEGPGEIPVWLRLVAVEKTAPPRVIDALRCAADASIVLLVLTDVATKTTPAMLPKSLCERLSRLFEEMAKMLAAGRYPIDVCLIRGDDEAGLPIVAATLIEQLRVSLQYFAMPARDAAQSVAVQPARNPPGRFFLPDAFSNPEHFHYALKTTFAALFCYVLYSLLNWPGIHTCFITCYIVALSTTAESVEKLTLRILGCLLGAAAGIGTIVYVMPWVTSIGGLMVVVFLGAFVAAWIAAGGPRIGYAGFQVAFAFFLSVIQGPAPAFDMVVARDRVIGILIGIVISYGVSAYLWPVSVARRIDPQIGALLRKLSAAAAAPSASMRRTIGALALSGLRACGQDLGLLSYEPRVVRPPVSWEQSRAQLLKRIAVLVGPLLLAASSQATVGNRASRRLSSLANLVGREPTAADTNEGIAAEDDALALWRWLEGPLGAVEAAIATDFKTPAGNDHAPA